MAMGALRSEALAVVDVGIQNFVPKSIPSGSASESSEACHMPHGCAVQGMIFNGHVE
jgi:hypothetical protein